MQTKTKKKKSKKSKQDESNADKVSGDITNAVTIAKKTKTRKGKKRSKQTPAIEKSKVNKTLPREPDVSSDHKDTASDPNAAANSVNLKESDKESNTIEGSNTEELKQERSSVGETLIKIIHTNKITEDSHIEQDSGDTADPNKGATEQSKVEESQIREADVSSEQNDAGADHNVADGAVKVTTATPEEGEEIGVSKISEAIHKMTQTPTDLPDQAASVEKSTFDTISDLPEIFANDIMQKQITWASPEDSLQQAIAKMQQTNSGYIMVGQNGTLEGVVSKSDIKKAMSPYLLPIFAKWRRPLDDATLKIRIKWIMSRPVRTIRPQTPLVTIMENMSQFRGQCLPVMDEEGNVRGLVTAFNIFQTLLKHNSNTCSTDEASPELAETASSTETT